MKIGIGLIILYLLLPFIGLFTTSQYHQNIFGFISDNLIYSNLIHILIVLTGVIISTLFVNKRNIIFKANTLDDFHVKRILSKCLYMLIFSLFIILVFGGYKILLGADRGEFRVSIGGGFGPIYTLLTVFLTPTILTYSTIYYLLSSRNYVHRKKLFYCVLISLITGLSTGYKFTALLILLPTLIHCYQVLRVKHLIIIGSTFFLLMVGSAILVMKSSSEDAALYVLARATSVASYGTVAVWDNFPEGAKDSYHSFLSLFGNGITSFLTGVKPDTVEFVKYNLSRHITYVSYPDTYASYKGYVNLTLTNFGEGVYYFGRNYFFIFSILSSFIIGFGIKVLFWKREKSFIIFNSLISVYFTTVLLQWISGGGITSLFQIPVLIYFILTYFILRLINAKVYFKTSKSMIN